MKMQYGSPYAMESTHIRFLGSEVGAEVTRHLWAVAREYRESFDVYGAIRTFEWSQTESGKHKIYLGENAHDAEIPDFASCLPAEIQSFTRAGVYGEGDGSESHRSFVQGGGHGGSHPHLAHRLLMAALGEEKAYPDAVQAANITCSGILSHESAMQGGGKVYLPEWTLSDAEPFLVELDQTIQPAWADETTVL
jgi:hypothetical protein